MALKSCCIATAREWSLLCADGVAIARDVFLVGIGSSLNLIVNRESGRLAQRAASAHPAMGDPPPTTPLLLVE
jgi:hypothetical protein